MFPCYTKEKGEIQMTAEYKNCAQQTGVACDDA